MAPKPWYDHIPSAGHRAKKMVEAGLNPKNGEKLTEDEIDFINALAGPQLKDPVDDLCRVVHQANDALRVALGEVEHGPWDKLGMVRRASTRTGVEKILSGEIENPEESHESWCDYMKSNGWIYGPEVEESRREHSNLVDYEDLPAVQRAKDDIFFALVSHLAPVLIPEPEVEPED